MACIIRIVGQTWCEFTQCSSGNSKVFSCKINAPYRSCLVGVYTYYNRPRVHSIARAYVYTIRIYYIRGFGFVVHRAKKINKNKIPFNQFKAIRSLLLVQAEDKLSTLIFFYTSSPVVFGCPSSSPLPPPPTSLLLLCRTRLKLYVCIHTLQR